MRKSHLVVALGLALVACRCDEGIKAVTPKISVDPAKIDFGSIPVGSSSTQPVSVSNSGRVPLTISSIKVADKNDVSIPVAKLLVTDCTDTPRMLTGDAVLTIAAGGCARFSVKFTPQAVEMVSTKVVIESNDPKTPSLEIPVTAEGAIKPFGTIKVCVLDKDGNEDAAQCTKLTDNPPFIPTLDFGQVLYGEPLTRKVRIYDEGSGNLSVTNLYVESSVPDFTLTNKPTLPLNIAPTMSTDVEVTVNPDNSQAESGKLHIASNDSASPSVEIPIVATEEGPCLKVSPTPTLDFGSITVGMSQSMSIDLENCGNVPYSFTALDLIPQTQGVFTAAQGDPNGVPALPFMFMPGDTRQIQITYAPKTASPMTGTGDTAVFSVRTSYSAHQNVNIVGHGAMAGCDGRQPTANIVVRDNSGNPVNLSNPLLPLTTVTLDGTGSKAAAGSSINQYVWHLDSAPANNTSTVGAAARFPFYLELSGDYVISLIVHSTSSSGDMCTSSPAQVTIHVVPPPGIHVELTWAENYGDVDLHYIGPGGALYQGPSDTPQGDLFWAYSAQTLFGTSIQPSYGNKPPDWGANNSVLPDGQSNDDASLDVDQLWGKGPENVNHPHPFDGDYTVAAHYYCSRDCSNGFSCGASNGPATATIKVFVNGTVAWKGSQSLTQRDTWEAATVHVAGNQVTVSPSTKAVYKITQGCTSDRN